MSVSGTSKLSGHTVGGTSRLTDLFWFALPYANAFLLQNNGNS